MKRHLLNAMIYFPPVQNACYLDNSRVFAASGVELAVALQCRTSELCHQRCHECCCCLLFQASIPSPFISKPFLRLLLSLTFPIFMVFFFPSRLLVHPFTFPLLHLPFIPAFGCFIFFPKVSFMRYYLSVPNSDGTASYPSVLLESW